MTVMKKKLNKTTKSNLITYAMVVIVYIIVQLLVSGGAVSSLMKGLLVPLCVYSILAVSLNLTVGILGELSLGHAGFMCIGAFTSATFSKLTNGVIQPAGVRFFLAILVGAVFAGIFGLLIGIPVLVRSLRTLSMLFILAVTVMVFTFLSKMLRPLEWMRTVR